MNAMKPPKEMDLECPDCKEVTPHEVLGGRVVGTKHLVLRSSVKCCECGRVHQVEVVEERPIQVPVVVSWREESHRSTIPMNPSDEVKVNDEIYHNGERVLVTSIESNEKRVTKAKASEITNIWGKKFDKVWVKISLDRHGKVYSKDILAIPEEEFEVGDVIDIEGNPAAITSIRLSQGRTIHRGAAAARDIVRIYSKGIRRKKGESV